MDKSSVVWGRWLIGASAALLLTCGLLAGLGATQPWSPLMRRWVILVGGLTAVLTALVSLGVTAWRLSPPEDERPSWWTVTGLALTVGLTAYVGLWVLHQAGLFLAPWEPGQNFRFTLGRDAWLSAGWPPVLAGLAWLAGLGLRPRHAFFEATATVIVVLGMIASCLWLFGLPDYLPDGMERYGCNSDRCPADILLRQSPLLPGLTLPVQVYAVRTASLVDVVVNYEVEIIPGIPLGRVRKMGAGEAAQIVYPPPTPRP